MPAGDVIFFALADTPAAWSDWAAQRLPEGDSLSYEDAGSQQFRLALLRQGRLQAVLYTASRPELPSPRMAKEQIRSRRLPAPERRALIAGRPLGGSDEGPIVCACFQVGRALILAAVAGGARSPAEIGIATRAGTNCGSCLPELARLAAHCTGTAAE